ncbi:tetratricopeptide repeat protein [Maridesulfovibrio sp. FT414]|uniref:tetratricopeptide repeat protein n=1 Tax=Maridesulfovibrio sp. FT414 TaxID=2979469 RepID=UPI003D8049B4
MKSRFLKISIRSLLAAIVLSTSISTNIFAASTSKQESFETWLEKYGAWDILENNYSTDAGSPDLILKRAETAYNLGRFSSCLEILQSTPSFENKKQEVSRLWLGGQAQRSLGDPVKAVIWFSQAARLMDTETMVARFTAEPYLKSVWFDVWRALFWGSFVTPESSREAREMLLSQSFNQAEKVWPTAYFVINSKPGLNVLNATSGLLPEIGNATVVSENDRILIAQSLASASLGEWDKSTETLEGLSNSTVGTFWQSVNKFLETGTSPENMTDFESGNLVRAQAFFKAGVLDPATASPALWQLVAPPSPAWSAFRKKLLEMEPNEALETIDRETGSMLLSTELVGALQNYRFAFALLSGNLEEAESVWKKLDNDRLPMSLRIAAAIVFRPPLAKVLNSSDQGQNDHLFIVANLCEAAGVDYFPSTKMPFWHSFSSTELNQKINVYPLDRLLLFTELNMAADLKMDESLARRSAFLFPGSELGARSFIYLAENAAQKRDFNLSAFYLKRVNQDKFGPKIRLKWLAAAVEYNLSAGEDAKALKGYNEILDSGGTLSPEKELKLALMIQQKGDLKKAQAILERIWENKNGLNDELKAEILFWIAEGEHAMGDKEKALKHYLELAWEFPEQNIWAVTAMYRASMIYEHKGQFETAKRFLKTVIKRADRKAQKEAAEARLNAIEGKLTQAVTGKETSFPF